MNDNLDSHGFEDGTRKCKTCGKWYVEDRRSVPDDAQWMLTYCSEECRDEEIAKNSRKSQLEKSRSTRK